MRCRAFGSPCLFLLLLSVLPSSGWAGAPGPAQPSDCFTKAAVWLIKEGFCRITSADGLSGLKLPGFGDAAFHLFPFVSLCAVAATQHL